MNTFTAEMNDEEKSIYLEALKYILGAAKTDTPENKDFLLQQAQKAGFDKKQLKNLPRIKTAEEMAAEIKKIPSVRKKRFIIREMIMVALADHELSDQEMCDIYKIGTAAGIKEDKINDFFLWAAQGLEWQIEGNRLVEEDI